MKSQTWIEGKHLAVTMVQEEELVYLRNSVSIPTSHASNLDITDRYCRPRYLVSIHFEKCAMPYSVFL